MKPKVNHIPDGYRSITPYLIIKDAAKAIDFYKKIFNAEEILRIPGPDGKVGHAEIRIGDSIIMMGDENVEMGHKGPKTFGGSPIGLMLYCESVDATVKKAVENGAKITRPVQDQFYGDRSGSIEDPFGHLWHVSTHVEDVTPEELKRRLDAMGKG